MNGCKPRHTILSTSHIDSASADTPSDDDVLTYEDATSLWRPKALPAAGVTSHGELDDLDVDDHLIYALLAGRAGGQTLMGGTASGEHLQLESTAHATKGEVQIVDGSPFVSRNIYRNMIGQGAGNADYMLRIQNSAGFESVSSSKRGIYIDPNWQPSANNLQFIGLGGLAIVLGVGRTGLNVFGLDFIAAAYGGTFVDFVGARATAYDTPSGNAVYTNMEAVRGYIYAGADATMQNMIGLRSANAGRVGAVNAIGLAIDDITAGTNRYLWRAGPTIATGRLDAGTPGAGETMLYLAEGITPTLRRVQWIDPGVNGGNFAGGEKVMILV